jgi:hypothetical protein
MPLTAWASSSASLTDWLSRQADNCRGDGTFARVPGTAPMTAVRCFVCRDGNLGVPGRRIGELWGKRPNPPGNGTYYRKTICPRAWGHSCFLPAVGAILIADDLEGQPDCRLMFISWLNSELRGMKGVSRMVPTDARSSTHPEAASMRCTIARLRAKENTQ